MILSQLMRTTTRKTNQHLFENKKNKKLELKISFLKHKHNSRSDVDKFAYSHRACKSKTKFYKDLNKLKNKLNSHCNPEISKKISEMLETKFASFINQQTLFEN